MKTCCENIFQTKTFNNILTLSKLKLDCMRSRHHIPQEQQQCFQERYVYIRKIPVSFYNNDSEIVESIAGKQHIFYLTMLQKKFHLCEQKFTSLRQLWLGKHYNYVRKRPVIFYNYESRRVRVYVRKIMPSLCNHASRQIASV